MVFIQFHLFDFVQQLEEITKGVNGLLLETLALEYAEMKDSSVDHPKSVPQSLSPLCLFTNNYELSLQRTLASCTELLSLRNVY